LSQRKWTNVHLCLDREVCLVRLDLEQSSYILGHYFSMSATFFVEPSFKLRN